MRKHRVTKPAAVLAVAVLSAATLVIEGCRQNNTGSDAGGSGNTAQVKQITIGYNPTIVQPQVLVGLHDSDYLYVKEMPGVSVNGRPYDAGPDVLVALQAGVIQIGCSGPFPALNSYTKNGDIVLLCGAAAGGTQLMVGKDSPIKTIKDLKGKVIGVNQPGSTVEAMVRYQLVQHGLNPTQDVKFAQIKPAEQAEALKRDEVAAVAAPAPWPSDVAINGNGRPLLDWKQIYADGKYLAGSFFTTKKFAEENPELIKQFLAANKTITESLNKDRNKGNARVLAAWSKVTQKKLDPKVAKAAFSTITFTVDADEAALQKFADINHELGVLRQKADLKGFVYQPK